MGLQSSSEYWTSGSRPQLPKGAVWLFLRSRPLVRPGTARRDVPPYHTSASQRGCDALGDSERLVQPHRGKYNHRLSGPFPPLHRVVNSLVAGILTATAKGNATNTTASHSCDVIFIGLRVSCVARTSVRNCVHSWAISQTIYSAKFTFGRPSLVIGTLESFPHLLILSFKLCSAEPSHDLRLDERKSDR